MIKQSLLVRFLMFSVLLFVHPIESFKLLDGLPDIPLSLPLFPITEIQTPQRVGYEYQSYQKSITCTAESVRTPTSIEEIQNIVLEAKLTKKKVKAVGILHSVTDCICTQNILINMSRITHFSYDADMKRATVGAGAPLSELLSKLHSLGRGLESAPSYASITVGGALGTGVHGSSLIHPSTLSDQAFAIRFVDGEGNDRTLNATEKDFRAFRVHLGLLGVIYEVVLDTTTQYKLQMLHYPVSDEILWNGTEIIDLAEDFDVFQFWWFPANKGVVLSVGRRIPVSQPGTCESHQIPEAPKLTSTAFSLAIELMQSTRDYIGLFLVQSYAKLSLYKTVPGRSPFYTQSDGRTPCLPEATGYSHKIMTNECKECVWKHGDLSLLVDDSNVAVPLTKFYPALHTIREIVDKEFVLFPLNGIYFRFLKSSDAYVAMNSGKDAVSIEWITNPRFDKAQPKLGITGFQAIGQNLVKKFNARPHWAKTGIMYLHPEILHRVHPQLYKFIQAMEKYDPAGVFMNDLGTRIRDERNNFTVTESLLERCALTEVCACRNNENCGDYYNDPLAYECKHDLGAKVCKQPENLVEDLKRSLLKHTVHTLTSSVNTNEDFLFDMLCNYKPFGDMFSSKRRRKGGIKTALSNFDSN